MVFKDLLCPCALDESILSIGRVKLASLFRHVSVDTEPYKYLSLFNYILVKDYPSPSEHYAIRLNFGLSEKKNSDNLERVNRLGLSRKCEERKYEHPFMGFRIIIHHTSVLITRECDELLFLTGLAVLKTLLFLDIDIQNGQVGLPII